MWGSGNMTPLILSAVGTKWLWLVPGGQESGWDPDRVWTVENLPTRQESIHCNLVI